MVSVFQIGSEGPGGVTWQHLADICSSSDHELAGIHADSLDDGHARYARSAGLEPEIFDSLEKLYHRVQSSSSPVVIDTRAPGNPTDGIDRAHRHGARHLLERPVTLEPESRKAERIAGASAGVHWLCDMLEWENPAVRAARRELESPENIRAFCESAAGVQKAIGAFSANRAHGCDILDRMQHCSYAAELAGAENLVDAEAFSLMPSGSGPMSVRGGAAARKDDVATARTTARLSGEAELEVSSSWTGVREETRNLGERLEAETGQNPVRQKTMASGDQAYRFSEARFFLIEGSKNMFGDLISGDLYDLETGEEIDTPSRTALRSTLEKTLSAAEGAEIHHPSPGFDDRLMQILTEARRSISTQKGVEKGREEIEEALM